MASRLCHAECDPQGQPEPLHRELEPAHLDVGLRRLSGPYPNQNLMVFRNGLRHVIKYQNVGRPIVGVGNGFHTHPDHVTSSVVRRSYRVECSIGSSWPSAQGDEQTQSTCSCRLSDYHPIHGLVNHQTLAGRCTHAHPSLARHAGCWYVGEPAGQPCFVDGSRSARQCCRGDRVAFLAASLEHLSALRHPAFATTNARHHCGSCGLVLCHADNVKVTSVCRSSGRSRRPCRRRFVT